ncbi:MAG: acetyl-CoA carboxylase biotin carboxyl carrier protein [Mangrovibacterium sp.]
MKKKFQFKINGNEYNTEILNVEDNVAEIEVNGTTYQVELTDRIKPTPKTPKLVRSQPIQAAVTTPAPTTPSAGGAHDFKSPLPGTILDVKKRVGDTVKTGDVVMLLEAMKMENNIEADRDGKISSIAKDKGDTVMEGEVLFTID